MGSMSLVLSYRSIGGSQLGLEMTFLTFKKYSNIHQSAFKNQYIEILVAARMVDTIINRAFW